MLSLLHISQFAIVDQLEVEFSAGFTVITGETGAGKSILMDALGLCLGDRADASLVRTGSARAEISATFVVAQLPDALSWLSARDLDEGDECTLRRSIHSDGRSRGFINGKPATLTDLRQLGELLIDIHSQHEHQTLLRKDSHRKLIDSYAQLDTLAAATATSFQHWQSLAQQLTHAQQHQAEQLARQDILSHLLEELTSLSLADGEYTSLSQRHDALANIGSLQEDGEHLMQLLQESDEGNVLHGLHAAMRLLEPHLTRSNALHATHELLSSAKIHIEEAVPTLRGFLESLEADPMELSQLEQRLSLCHQLARKHRCTPEELPDVQRRLEAEQAALQLSLDLAQLEQKTAQALSAYTQEANKLRAHRQDAALKLCAEVQQFLSELGMAQAKLALHFTELSRPSIHGLDDIELRFSANAGQELRSLAKVASGGELSRLSLAIQVINARHSPVPVMVFDEVDVGIGGGIAEVVGRLLRELGSHAQVFSITHQPQVAACGHHHMRVEKRSAGEHTSSQVVQLSAEERIEEVARMSGGIDISDATREHAKRLLQAAH